jgi:hypothetical protein
MKRAFLAFVAMALVLSGHRPGAQQPPGGEQPLVGTWTLVSVQQRVDSGTPATIQGARGLLVFDAGGHAFEIVTRATPEPLEGLTEAQARFQSIAGSWGGYRADMRERTITYEPLGAVSPNVMGTRFTRTFEAAGDRVIITSRPGELHAQGVTRWTWERMPVVENLSDGYRSVVGFWQHVVERRQNTTTGAVISETRRAPSVIVYTPAGYVGVHFPTLDRPRFASGEPTDAEARAQMGYLGYFGALGVHPGMVVHNILAGGLASGSILRRFYELKGDELNIRFPPGTNRGGQQTTTFVTLRRLSGAKEMLGR